MRSPQSKSIILALLLSLGAVRGGAQTLTSTFQFTASGFVDTPATATAPFQGKTFTNSAITITAIGNTGKVGNDGSHCYYVPSDSSTISIAGTGTYQFSSTVLTNCVSVDPLKGVTGNILYFAVSPSAAIPASYTSSAPVATAINNSTAWTMTSSFGPFQSIIDISPFQAATNGGTLQFTSQGTNGSFQATFSGTPPPPTLTRNGVLPHFVIGGYWDSKINLLNTSSKPVTATLNFRNDDGTPWNLPLTIAQLGATQSSNSSSVNLTISANATAVIASPLSPSSNSIWGWVDVQTSAPINGFAILRSTPPNDKPSEATVALQSSFPSSLVLPYDNSAGYVMGVAIVNLSSNTTFITATAWDDAGAQLGVRQLTVSGNGHTAFVLTDQLGITAGRRGFVQFQNPGGAVGGLGLRFSPSGPFTDIPAVLQ
jgi:hypothetical protein